MLKYKNNLTLSKGGPDIGLKIGILAEIGNMLHECAVLELLISIFDNNGFVGVKSFCVCPLLMKSPDLCHHNLSKYQQPVAKPDKNPWTG